MERKRRFTLGGKTTSLYFSEGGKDLMRWLGTYSEELFWIIDGHIAEMFRQSAIPERSVIVKGGDRNKTAEQLLRIRDRALQFGVTGRDRIVVLGGGVSIDLAATACCAYFPGVKLTLIPTTLMAMTDGAIGGKCGVNSGERRYECRDTYPADDIVFEVGFLSKLSFEDMRNGFGEIIKHALISPTTELFDLLMAEKNAIRSLDRGTMEQILMRSIDIKITYLTVAEKHPVAEKILELGHRFGFAFMIDGEGGAKHGEAVVWGIAQAIALGVKEGITDPHFARKVTQLMNLYQYDTAYKFPRNAVTRILESYSEAYGVEEHEFILLSDQGKPVFTKLDSDHLAWFLS